MVYRTRINYTAAQKADIWDRWQRGEYKRLLKARRRSMVAFPCREWDNTESAGDTVPAIVH